MTNARILDTNVLINANGDQSPQTSIMCRILCMEMLSYIMAGRYKLVLDVDKQFGSDALNEYRNKLIESGSGVGNAFFQWVLTNHWRTDAENAMFTLVHLTKTNIDEYEEFPKHSGLKKFDPRDRKWVAIANAHQQRHGSPASIVQSADTKWMAFSDVFAELNVLVEFICDLSSSPPKPLSKPKK